MPPCSIRSRMKDRRDLSTALRHVPTTMPHRRAAGQSSTHTLDVDFDQSDGEPCPTFFEAHDAGPGAPQFRKSFQYPVREAGTAPDLVSLCVAGNDLYLARSDQVKTGPNGFDDRFLAGPHERRGFGIGLTATSKPCAPFRFAKNSFVGVGSFKLSRFGSVYAYSRSLVGQSGPEYPGRPAERHGGTSSVGDPQERSVQDRSHYPHVMRDSVRTCAFVRGTSAPRPQ